MTGVDAMLHPEMVRTILASGRNEVGVHRWIHEFPPRLEPGEEERLLDRAIDYLTNATGKRPVGYRAPSWAFSGSTLDLIVKKRFLYDSSLQALDEPYEILSHGTNTGVVELAIDWTLTETPISARTAACLRRRCSIRSIARSSTAPTQRRDDLHPPCIRL